MTSNHPSLGGQYHFLDHKKILYHFSSVHYKQFLSPFYETNQRHSWIGCEFCPRNVAFHETPGADERYDSSQSVRSLPVTKCVFLHLDDYEKEVKGTAGYHWVFDSDHGELICQHTHTGHVERCVPYEIFDPIKFQRGQY